MSKYAHQWVCERNNVGLTGSRLITCVFSWCEKKNYEKGLIIDFQDWSKKISRRAGHGGFFREVGKEFRSDRDEKYRRK